MEPPVPENLKEIFEEQHRVPEHLEKKFMEPPVPEHLETNVY